MYAGKKAEEAPVKALFRQPLHPYTKGLLVRCRGSARRKRGERPRLPKSPEPCLR